MTDRIVPVNTGNAHTEIPLSGWKRSLCYRKEYPAFGDPEPVVIPDTAVEQIPGFSGYACYETIFVLENPKSLLLEISGAAGNVEVFMNGETAGLRGIPPCHCDLSGFAWAGKNYLSIEVAFTTEQTQHDEAGSKTAIIGFVRLYTY
jgi:hypothetical protein